MTSTIAFIGKSGSGKTTVVRSFLKLIRKNFSKSSILLVDNDLSLELSQSFDINTKNTIYGVKSGKHEYKTGIPEGMSKQEFIDWALEDIIVSIDENTDIIASWLVTPKDCKCPSTKQVRDSLSKLILRYDFVIFDCEYDLKYLNLLVEAKIDEAIIVSNCKKQDFLHALKIAQISKKFAHEGQLDIILNKTTKEKLNSLNDVLNNEEAHLLGVIEEFENDIDYEAITRSLENMYPRMNLEQNEM